jgi:hypothetical protein
MALYCLVMPTALNACRHKALADGIIKIMIDGLFYDSVRLYCTHRQTHALCGKKDRTT